jgi:hypothetical protein
LVKEERMKLYRVLNVSSLLVVVLAVVLLCFVAPSAVLAVEEMEEKTTGEKMRKEKVTEELPPGEAEDAESPWLFIVDFNAFYTYSDLNDGDNTSGSSGELLFAPVYQFNDQTFLIMMYDGQYRRQLEFFSDAIGSKQRNEFMSHTVQPMLRFDYGERNEYSLTPSVFATFTYNKDVDTDGWEDGLYNYRDYGVGLDFDWRGLFGDPGTGSLTGQFYKREYPNYDSLLSLTGLDTSTGGLKSERNEKDYHAVLGKTGYTWIQPNGFNYDVSYSLLYKMLDDKKIVQSDGTLSGEEPDEYVHTFDLNPWYMFDVAGGMKLGMDLRYMINDSEQNYYDGMETASLADDVYVGDYFDYNLSRVRPSISYTAATIPLTTTIYYSYQHIEYDERNAKEAGGAAYKTSSHYEDQKEFGAELRYELTESWAVIGRLSQLTQRSNNDDERTYRYNYTVDYYSIGVAFKY